ncbi:MAG: nucleoside phosphorylase [Christensenellales bacterium]|jgi:uridine phosphorylase
MIIHAFDDKSEPLFSPGSFYGEQKRFCDICIVTFSNVIYEAMRNGFACEQIAKISLANGAIPICRFEHEGRSIAFYLSAIGSALAGTCVLEANWLTGATKFIMFGSAGSLNRQVTEGKYVIPTEAYRDEGLSYHYAPPADYISIPGSEKLAEIFASLGLPFVKGRVWTTDAIYRETVNKVKQRRQEGCIAVEMELAGVQAVCDFCGFELYDFLVTGDVLDEGSYDIAGFSGANHDLDKLYVALQTAKRI